MCTCLSIAAAVSQFLVHDSQHAVAVASQASSTAAASGHAKHTYIVLQLKLTSEDARFGSHSVSKERLYIAVMLASLQCTACQDRILCASGLLKAVKPM